MLALLNLLLLSVRSIFLSRFFIYFLVLFVLSVALSVNFHMMSAWRTPLVEYFKSTIAADAVFFDQHLTLGVSAKEKAKSLQYTQAIVAEDVAHTLYTRNPVTIFAVNANGYPLRSHVLIDTGHDFYALKHGPEQGKVWISPRLGAALNVGVGQTIVIGKRSFLVQFWLDDLPGRFILHRFQDPLVLMNIDDFVRMSLPHVRTKEDVLLLLGKKKHIQAFVERLPASTGATCIIASDLHTKTMPPLLDHLSLYIHVFFLLVFAVLFIGTVHIVERYTQDTHHVAQMMTWLGGRAHRWRQWTYVFYMLFFAALWLLCFLVQSADLPRMLTQYVLIHTVAKDTLNVMLVDSVPFFHWLCWWLLISLLWVFLLTEYRRRDLRYAAMLRDGMTLLYLAIALFSIVIFDGVAILPYVSSVLCVALILYLFYVSSVYLLRSVCARLQAGTQHLMAFLYDSPSFFSAGWLWLLCITLLSACLTYAFVLQEALTFPMLPSTSFSLHRETVPATVLPHRYHFSAKGVFLQKKSLLETKGAKVAASGSWISNSTLWRGHIGVIFSSTLPLGFETDHYAVGNDEVAVMAAFAHKNGLHIGDQVGYLIHGMRYLLTISSIIRPEDASVSYPFSWVMNLSMEERILSHQDEDEKKEFWENPFQPLSERLEHFQPYQRQRSVFSHHSPTYLLSLYRGLMPPVLGVVVIATLFVMFVMLILTYRRAHYVFRSEGGIYSGLPVSLLCCLFLWLPSVLPSQLLIYWVFGLSLSLQTVCCLGWQLLIVLVISIIFNVCFYGLRYREASLVEDPV